MTLVFFWILFCFKWESYCVAQATLGLGGSIDLPSLLTSVAAATGEYHIIFMDHRAL